MSRSRKESPRYNVVSIRLTNAESQHLERIVGKTHKCVSHFMRDAMNYFLAQHEQVQVE